MKIGSITENRDKEQRVAITPEIVKKYSSLGLEVCLSKDYASHLGINSKLYEIEGATILNSDDEVISTSNAILQMNIPNDTNLNKLKKDQILIGEIIPLCKAGILIGSIFVITVVMGDFLTIGIMGGQQIASIGKIIQVEMAYLQLPAAAANAVILLVVTLLMIFLMTRIIDIRKEL